MEQFKAPKEKVKAAVVVEEYVYDVTKTRHYVPKLFSKFTMIRAVR